MDSAESLREKLFELQGELNVLRVEAKHARLLLTSLGTLLDVDLAHDPFSAIFDVLREVFAFSHLLVLSRTPHEGTLECISATRPSLIGSQWIAGRFFRKVLGGKVAATFDNGALPEWQSAPDEAFTLGTCALCLPLQVRDTRAIMVLLRSAEAPLFSREDIGFAHKFALLASHALAVRYASHSEAERLHLRKITQRLHESQKALRFRADYDALTKIANREHIQTIADAAMSEAAGGRGIGLAFIDLDNFKKINDRFGHAAGDSVLEAVAARISGDLRPGDRVGRISGDEFVVMFDPSPDQAALESAASRLRAAICRPLSVGGVLIDVSASIGVALYPHHGRDYEALRRNADTAMYRAKSTRKGSVVVFEPRLGDEASARLELEAQVRGAVDRQEFTCALQPKVRLADNAIIGYEALARWVEPDGTIHGPGAFLEVATDLGLLSQITDQVLDGMLAVQARLSPIGDGETGSASAGRRRRSPSISINVSAQQATDLAFMQSLVLRLCTTPSPGSYIIEVTEDALLATSVFRTEILPLLREAGIRISIDDFGTGYSSLAVLSDIVADELKIDRSIITGIHQRPRNQSILRAIASLGRALDIQLVAEGIETDEERDYLLSLPEIGLGQGFLFGRPELAGSLRMVGADGPGSLDRVTG